MPLPRPEPGLVVSYAYLWRHEHNRGEQDGSKVRPCAIVLTAENRHGRTIVTVAPITHAPPTDPQRAVPLPPAVKRRLGLDDAESWIIADEVNRYAWPGPDLRPVSRRDAARFDFGFLPEDIFDRLRSRMLALHRAGQMQLTPRNE